MVSFLQAQCLNCGTVDDVISMDSRMGEASWCSQCGFTRRTADHMMQERQLQQQLLAEDEQLAALLSKNMWLSESQAQAQSQEQPPRPAAAAAPASAPASAPAVATPGANISISQHYHHYHPIAPRPPPPAPASALTEPTYIQHLLTTSPNPEAALKDYHRQLSLMEEQYHHHHRLHQQQQTQTQTQYPPSPTGSTVSSIQDDHTLQMILLEQHNLAQEAEKLRQTRAQEEEQMIFNQLMMDTSSREDDLMSDDEAAWSGGQPMPNILHHQQQMQSMDMMGQKVVYPVAPGQLWVTTEEDIYGMDDEDSPCSIYYSKVANFL